jgi:hypothetical protein
MPSLNNARKNNAIRIAAGGETGTGVGNYPPNQSSVTPTPQAPQDLPIGAGLPQRGMFSADLVLASDRSDSSRVFRGQGTRSATFPYQSAPIKTSPTVVTSEASSSTVVGSSLVLETNGLLNPNQSLQNVVGVGISIQANPDGSVVFEDTNTGDGLAHGDPIWDVDTAYVLLRDDFTVTRASSSSGGAIGELAWIIGGTAGTAQYQWAGIPPHLGTISWSNATSSGNSACLWGPNAGATANGYINSMALLNNPGWKMVYVFQFSPLGGASGVAASFTSKSFYLGLTGDLSDTDVASSASRPQIFIGLRYDTDRTNPSIADTTFHFEVVQNTLVSSYSRNNTQGTTYDTGITPTANTWYRLEILCTVAGSVQLSLYEEGQSSGQTSTIAVSTYTVTLTGNAAAIENTNGIAEFSFFSHQHPWGPGAAIVISGLTGSGAGALDGSWVVDLPNGSSTSIFWTNPEANVSDVNTNGTVTGYPNLVPCIRWGNNTTAGSWTQDTYFQLDFFGFVWNSGLAAAPLSLAQTNSRWTAGS